MVLAKSNVNTTALRHILACRIKCECEMCLIQRIHQLNVSVESVEFKWFQIMRDIGSIVKQKAVDFEDGDYSIVLFYYSIIL